MDYIFQGFVDNSDECVITIDGVDQVFVEYEEVCFDLRRSDIGDGFFTYVYVSEDLDPSLHCLVKIYHAPNIGLMTEDATFLGFCKRVEEVSYVWRLK